MTNFLHNKKWSDAEWNIYFNNIELLRLNEKLSKSEFNSLLGVSNAYRKDRHKASYETISKICKKFNVSEKWLSSPHELLKNGQGKIKEYLNFYDEHGGYTKHTTDELTRSRYNRTAHR